MASQLAFVVREGKRRTRVRTLEELASLLLDLPETIELADDGEDILLRSGLERFAGGSEHAEGVSDGVDLNTKDRSSSVTRRGVDIK
jgi:hypothetical protein